MLSFNVWRTTCQMYQTRLLTRFIQVKYSSAKFQILWLKTKETDWWIWSNKLLFSNDKHFLTSFMQKAVNKQTNNVVNEYFCDVKKKKKSFKTFFYATQKKKIYLEEFCSNEKLIKFYNLSIQKCT